jgi:hypothetical protein
MFLILLISFDFVSLFSFSFSPHGIEDAEGGWLVVIRA